MVGTPVKVKNTIPRSKKKKNLKPKNNMMIKISVTPREIHSIKEPIFSPIGY